MADYLSVTQLNKYLGLKFSKDPYLERVYLTGQVSNFRKRPTHQYFSLKDEGAAISATMWSKAYQKLGFDLENDMKVNVIGRVQIYEKTGQYSIIIEQVIPDGIGALAVQFEQLKKKLTQLGYFEAQHKQTLPRFVQKIGVVTSPSGAVIHDIETTIQRRFPGVEILLFPTKVQGDGASFEIAENIARANQRDDLDVLIVARGGGSMEDLWPFNEERVVEAIFASRLPVISSVGHETDTTLSDLVSDDRAATPTAAAEHATPITKSDVLARLSELQDRATQATLRCWRYNDERYQKIIQSVIFRQPERLYDGYMQKLDHLTQQLMRTMRHHYQEKQSLASHILQRLDRLRLEDQVVSYRDRIVQDGRLLHSYMGQIYDMGLARFEKANDALLSLDTSRIIARGYAIVRRRNQIISSARNLDKGDQVVLEMKDGYVTMEVADAETKDI